MSYRTALEMDKMPDVSVVLPTYNRQAQLQQVLVGLEQQSYPLTDFEVIVVSDGSTDGTNEYLQTFAKETPLDLTVVIQTNQGPAAARNNGVQAAKGELVLFIDDDVVPVPQLIEAHMATHQRYPGEVVVMGPMLTPTEFDMKPWVRWEQAMLDKQYATITADAGKTDARRFYTGNASWPVVICFKPMALTQRSGARKM
ncbi:MAG: glycosyltransferase family A protein [Caldilineaceae bacterium]